MQKAKNRIFHLVLPACLLLVSCATSPPRELGLAGAKFLPCPDSPNCVSSDSLEKKHAIIPLTFGLNTERAWEVLPDQVVQLPRTRIVTSKPNYFHAESRSSVFGFVDDLEFHYRPEQGVIAVRSASRSGYFDFGVNRSRLETLREALVDQFPGGK
ncbi:MAG: DUF1499 domain-containing protein [Desulfuromonas sp.]|nr:MAG: DUF1499 domain-containing protein [Desulfuromonas sp.]